MKVPSIRFAHVNRGKSEALPGIVGVARVDRKTKVLVRRLEPGDIAVIDHPDLDRVSADELIACRVAAVVNAARSVTGRYPNLGPGLLLDAGIPVVDDAGQEVLTRDKVSVRVNISAQYRVTDPMKARQSVKNYAEFLYRSLQLAVRQSLGKKTLDEILAEKVDLDPALVEALREEMVEIGVELGAAAMKDIILTGEMREMMNQVVAAEKQAQANLIRRREETAATRSLLNTAKLMEENPLLIRMKELETLEKLTGKVERISLMGGFDGLLTNLLCPFEKKDSS